MKRGVSRAFTSSNLIGRRSSSLVGSSRSFTYKTASSLPSYLSNTPPTTVTTLDNKLRVASEYRHGETATVGVFIDAGSVWEDKQTNGVAHFLEHMAFKGTTSRTQEQIETEIENMGGQLNAYTSREQTVYHAHVFKKDVPKAVEILADILQNSSFKEEDIERERGVILREMVDVESQYDEVIFDHLHSIAYQGHPLGYTILGPEKNIKSIKRDDLVKYVQTHYTAPRMVVAAAGAVNHDEFVKATEKSFGKLPSSVNVSFKNSRPEFVGSAVHVRDDDIPLTYTAVAVESVGWSDPHYFVFMLLQTMIGSWDRTLGGGKNLSSRVCEAYAVDNLAHSLMTFNTCYHNTGLFGSYIVGEQEKMDDAIYEVIAEWVRIANKATPFEVENAKARLKATFLMQLDGTQSVCEDIGRQLLTLQRRLTPAEIFLRIDAIDVETVKAVAKQYLYDTDPAVAAMGSVDSAKFPDYHYIRGWTVWNRL